MLHGNAPNGKDMMTPRNLLFSILIASTLAIVTQSHAADDVTASLVPSHEVVTPGQSVRVGLRLDMAPDWHTYWLNPGDSGYPTSIRWTLPEGVTASPLQWPTPARYEVSGIINYGYSDSVILLSTLTIPADAELGSTLDLRARVDWLGCKGICVPGRARLAATLQVGPTAKLADGATDALAKAQARLPATRSAWSFSAYLNEGRVTLLMQPPPGADTATQVQLFPGPASVDIYAPQPFLKNGTRYELGVGLSEEREADPSALSGVLVSTQPWEGTAPSNTALDLNVPIQNGPPPAPADGTVSPAAVDARPDAAASLQPESTTSPYLLILLAAFVAGLILNLMPCVFPVLSLKVLGFVEQSRNGHAAWKHGVVFTLGVVLSFLALGGAFVALLEAGQNMTWGFQLQNPRVPTGLAILFCVMGLSMFGVFEFGSSFGRLAALEGRTEGLLSSFVSGILATIVATPCTGPIMGGALGATLTLPAAQSLGAFVTLGPGMPSPASPRLAAKVPAPGPWMESFKQAMGLLMLATVWVLLIVLRKQGADQVLRILGGLLLVATACWLLGRWGTPMRSALSRNIARGLALVIFVGGVAFSMTTAPVSKIDWVDYAESTLSEARSDGQAVFVDFTADWCLTCKVNERVALSSETVAQAFARADVLTLKADLTKHDEDLVAALNSFGRTGVPLYVYYPPEPGAEAVVLPEVITERMVIDLIEGR